MIIYLFNFSWSIHHDNTDGILTQCMQKIYEWRAHIGKAGIDAIEAVWASDKKYGVPEERKAYVEFALGSGLPFMYGEIAHIAGDTYKVSLYFYPRALSVQL
jgi:hypothetical protein